MLSRVIAKFTDGQDEGHLYNEGALYPRLGYKPTKKRIEELASGNNKRNLSVIEVIDLAKLKVDELKDIAKEREVNDYDSLKKAELIEALEGGQ
ncbi:Rho termination factor N-terminal domain-containing protein [Staphylococcus ratti]|uniref:Rho termination factor N-terminal domain-containing protein n=1 Tax=Staphylococcus ratti TaxID=2892440 RepID=A0ABY3PBR0_9STAP|nr:Rho termination factor N-terminal domain-containing protein [Staphylococcus ratti]UEX89693.1 Rho termination factor N-terminal domain-containing protein [Staphylococcus ratti]